MALVFIVAAVACAFGLLASLVVGWASGKSGLWNIGFGAVLIMAVAGVALIAIVLLMRRFSN